MLGVSYYHGHGVPQNTAKAIHWWKLAAAQGGVTGGMAQDEINVVERR